MHRLGLALTIGGAVAVIVAAFMFDTAAGVMALGMVAVTVGVSFLDIWGES